MTNFFSFLFSQDLILFMMDPRMREDDENFFIPSPFGNMKQCTLVLVFDGKDNILLCMKKRGFGMGKYNGAGGKVEPGETILQAAKRELQEETSIDVSTDVLVPRGIFHFFFQDKPESNMDVTLYTIHDYEGSFEETEEMKPEWFATSAIPFDKMWSDDIYWMPRILAGENIEYDFTFDAAGQVADYKLIK